MTLSPYMGFDSVEPFLQYPGKGVYLLAVTSNPGAADLELHELSKGRFVFELVGDMAGRAASTPAGEGSIGLVLGLTNVSADILARLPDVPLLIPGLGAQGGDLETLNGTRRKAPAVVNVSRGILYADQGGDFQHRTILLLSDRPPAPHIDGRYGTVRSRPIAEDFLAHPRYRFKVIVNPTRRDSASGKLLPVKGREAVAQWFLQRAVQSWGFEPSPEHLQIDKLQVLQFKDKAQRPVTLAQAHVQGQLIVTDRAQFQHSFSHGIGRGRAFGCGLLQIVPFVDHPFA